MNSSPYTRTGILAERQFLLGNRSIVWLECMLQRTPACQPLASQAVNDTESKRSVPFAVADRTSIMIVDE